MACRYSDSLSGQLQTALQSERWSEPICTIQLHSTAEVWNPPEPFSAPPMRQKDRDGAQLSTDVDELLVGLQGEIVSKTLSAAPLSVAPDLQPDRTHRISGRSAIGSPPCGTSDNDVLRTNDFCQLPSPQLPTRNTTGMLTTCGTVLSD